MKESHYNDKALSLIPIGVHMINFKKQIKNFDLYPFVTLATDSNGCIIYKNVITKSIYPNIRVGARLSSYTPISGLDTGIVRTELYGEEATLLIQRCLDSEISHIIAVFSPSCASFIKSEDFSDKYSSVLTGLAENDEKTDFYKQKHAFVRKINKSLDTVKACARFTRLYYDNCQYEKSECISLSSFFESLLTIFKKRLDTGIDFSLDSSLPDVSITVDKRSVMLLLNIICFSAAVTDDKRVLISFDGQDGTSSVKIKIKSSQNIGSIYDAENELPYIFSLLVGMSLAEASGFEYSFSNSEKLIEMRMTIPSSKPCEASLSSIGATEYYINEYIKLFEDIFKK